MKGNRQLCLYLFCAMFSIPEDLSASHERPNILIVFADDWGKYASVYAALNPGGPSDLVSTPNFDRIAKQGVLFTNAHVNAPSCTPCRSSLLTGRYFWQTGRGAILQGAVWDSSIPSFPLLLKAAGYHIGYTGKVWSPGRPMDAPFGGETKRYSDHGHWFNGFSQFLERHGDIEAGKKILLEEVRSNFRDFLTKRADDTPLCYWWGPTNCHRTWIQGSGKDYWGLDPDGLKGKLPAFLPDVPVIREDFADYLGEVQAFDLGLGVLLEELERIGELHRTLIVVSGDHGIPGFPNGKCCLYDFGTNVPLTVCWPGRVPPGRVVHDFVGLPDLTPTILEACGQPVPDGVSARSLMSVLTSMDSGWVDPQRDAVITGRERHIRSARTDNLPYPQRAIRTKDFLYIRNFSPERWPMGTSLGYGRSNGSLPDYEQLRDNTFSAFGDMDASPTKAWIAHNCRTPSQQKYFDVAFGRRPAEELYDMRTDPDQVTSLADNPAYDSARIELAGRLMEVLVATGDPRVTGTGRTYDQAPFARESDP